MDLVQRQREMECVEALQKFTTLSMEELQCIAGKPLATPTMSSVTSSRHTISSRLSTIEAINLDDLTVSQCPESGKDFVCCPGVNSHPNNAEYFRSPWTHLYVLPGKKASAAKPKGIAASDVPNAEEQEDDTHLSQKLQSVSKVILKSLGEYYAAYFPREADGSPPKYALNVTVSNPYVDQALKGNARLGPGAGFAIGSQGGSLVSYTLHISLIRAVEGKGRLVIHHTIAVEESTGGSRYQGAAKSHLILLPAESDDTTEVAGKASGVKDYWVDVRCNHQQRDPSSVAVTAKSGASAGNHSMTNDDSLAGLPRGGDMAGEASIGFLQSGEDLAFNVVTLVQDAETNSLFPTMFRVRLPLCSALVKRNLVPLEEPLAVRTEPVSTASRSPATPQAKAVKQAQNKQLALKEELANLAQKRKSRSGAGDAVTPTTA